MIKKLKEIGMNNETQIELNKQIDIMMKIITEYETDAKQLFDKQVLLSKKMDINLDNLKSNLDNLNVVCENIKNNWKEINFNNNNDDDDNKEQDNNNSTIPKNILKLLNSNLSSELKNVFKQLDKKEQTEITTEWQKYPQILSLIHI